MLGSGLLAQQFGKAGGQRLVNDLAHPKHGCFGYGEIRFTGAYDIHKGDDWPQKICHFCVPTSYDGDNLFGKFLRPVSIGFEESLSIIHLTAIVLMWCNAA